MKKLYSNILIFIIVACICCITFPYIFKEEKEITRIETVVDTVVVYKIDSSYIKCNDSLCLEIDSLNNKIKVLNEELFISNFKLERIKEYNRIAGNGNNITFLRGWINRVLNE